MLETAIPKQNESDLHAEQPDVLDQLLKPEIEEALEILVQNLPKLVEMMTLLTKTYDLATKVAGDRVLIQDTVGAVKEVVKPIEQKAKHFASAAIEAGNRMEQDTSKIGLFGMLRMFKDPELQRVLRFSKAYLDVLGERRK
ncbi:DUF1641 domain-containing protein [Paenibacillus lignilyticus]|uniref:DUF1641 domain-containing protein n=1 Tax=Paenibacillus lignilyticus TaxID=1172615 RepID=A0ABS5CAT4_9BACL|nr:DUF1641 domain-containing protein [Paenibacillus lignilyticus]MBP3963048.1 DUF1641 domain-containing protein [Paenibacillus lignilyticus]